MRLHKRNRSYNTDHQPHDTRFSGTTATDHPAGLTPSSKRSHRQTSELHNLMVMEETSARRSHCVYRCFLFLFLAQPWPQSPLQMQLALPQQHCCADSPCCSCCCCCQPSSSDPTNPLLHWLSWQQSRQSSCKPTTWLACAAAAAAAHCRQQHLTAQACLLLLLLVRLWHSPLLLLLH